MNSPQRSESNRQAWGLITKRIENETKHKNALVWGSVNLVLFAILAYDIYYTCPFHPWTLYSIEVLLATLFFMCSLYNLAQYLRLNHFTSPIELTAQQFRLFGICRQDPNFKLKYSSTPVVSPDVTPLNLSSNSWLSSSFISTYPNPNESSPGLNRSHPIFHDELDPIDSRESYRDYSMEARDRSLTIDYSPRAATGVDKTEIGAGVGMFRSFWSSPDAKCYTSIKNTSVYQSSPVSPNKTLSDSDSKSRLYLEDEVWKKLKINPYNLTKWTNNLKMWIHRTILLRLVKEIDAVNTSLLAHNMPDLQVGCVGLDRLRCISHASVGLSMGSLSLLVQFLSVSHNQEYVVNRIRELSKNWYLGDYKWSSGGSTWEPHLPTDSRLLMHLLITYFDSLAPTFGGQSGAPFSACHWSSGAPPKSGAPGVVTLHEASVNPPHYQLLVSPDHVYEIPKGRNNMFETVLAFLHYVKTKEHGVIDRLNLGPAGTNMLWIIAEPGSTQSSPKC
ncbi:hypothetical protein M8J76_000753 [Diaphorina citri]|nr:hypothetical protein M8J77_005424 [Diaphorina citri]KAI5708669.1 hypothetical protein M8J76_000753 [Diaphorina citri]